MKVASESPADWKPAIRPIIDHYGAKPTALIMVLQDIQKQYRYLPEDALQWVAREMNLPIAQIYGVSTFFRAFSLKPKGKCHICVCTGTACHVRQAPIILDKLQTDLGIRPGETTADMEFSLETVNCLGACALGPLVTVDGAYHGNVTVGAIDKLMSRLRTHASPPPQVEHETMSAA